MKVKCLWCGQTISSNLIHNMIWCKCHKTALDFHPIWPRIAFTRNNDGNAMFEIVEKDGECDRIINNIKKSLNEERK